MPELPKLVDWRSIPVNIMFADYVDAHPEEERGLPNSGIIEAWFHGAPGLKGYGPDIQAAVTDLFKNKESGPCDA